MKHWIVVASLDHVRAAVAGSFVQAGHGKRAHLDRMAPGDRLVCYCSKAVFGGNEPAHKLVGLGIVREGDVYQHGTPGAGSCPYRRDVDYDPAARETDIHPLLSRLSFITDVKHWGYPFRRGTFTIEAADYDRIAEAMRPS